jgi:hypothetical protein
LGLEGIEAERVKTNNNRLSFTPYDVGYAVCTEMPPAAIVAVEQRR